GYDPDTSKLSLGPFIPNRKPSDSPLYAVVWSGRFQSPQPIVAGADGQLHVPAGNQWKSIPITEGNRPIYSMAAHPVHPILALGFATKDDKSMGKKEWLSVWPEDGGFPIDKARDWAGHRG